MNKPSVINIDRIILGDNQFFGVNHMSQDKGTRSYEKFRDLSEIKKIMYCALDNGVTGVFFSTHPDILNITNMIRRDPALKNGFSIYVNVPYIVKYVQMLNEMGLYRSVKSLLKGKTWRENIVYGIRTSINLIQNDYLGIADRLIDLELNPFHDLNVKAVFLHNGLADLALGYDMANVVRHFYDYIDKRYKLIPAFGTLNFPLFNQILEKAGISSALVMTSVNKKGFLMNPSKEVCEKAIQNSDHLILAMGTLASGSLKPNEAYEYLGFLKRVKHVVVGFSSEEHGIETFQAIRKYLTK